jgi:hypothetical protein
MLPRIGQGADVAGLKAATVVTVTATVCKCCYRVLPPHKLGDKLLPDQAAWERRTPVSSSPERSRIKVH